MTEFHPDECKNGVSTPVRKKRRKLKQRQLSDSDDEANESELNSAKTVDLSEKESKDEIRMRKEMLLNLEALNAFFKLSEKLKMRLLRDLKNESINNDVGCVKIVKSFGNLEQFGDVEQFRRLKAYQQCGVHWLSLVHEVENSSAILADEMGLFLYNQYIRRSKNRLVFSNLEGVDFVHEVKLVFIIVPMSIINNWKNEFKTWSEIKHVVIYHDTQAKRSLVLDKLITLLTKNEDEIDKFIVILTTFGMINDDLKSLRKLQPFEYLIIDEAHLIKNSNTNIYKKLNNYQFKHKLLLTGTPIQNNMNELCNLLQFSMTNMFNSYEINSAIYDIIHNYEYIMKNLNLNDELSFLVEYLFSSSSNSQVESNTTQTNSNPVHNINTLEPSDDVNTIQPNSHSEVLGDSSVKDRVDNSVDLVDEIYSHINSIMEKNKEKYIVNRELKVLQNLTTPFVLRRLKQNVMDELPVKESFYVPCYMTKVQENLYSLFTNSTNSNTNSNSIQPSSNNSTQPSHSVKSSEVGDLVESSVIKTVNSVKDISVEEVEDSVGNSFMDKKIHKLRRIANHPLLVRHFYSDEIVISKVGKIIKTYHGDFDDVNENKLIDHLLKLSDFEIYSLLSQSLYHLLDPVDTVNSVNRVNKVDSVNVVNGMDKLLIKDEMFFESCKVNKMLDLVDQIAKRGEKVLVFSQFTHYLDIIEKCFQIKGVTNYLRLDGSLTLNERLDIINTFNSNKRNNSDSHTTHSINTVNPTTVDKVSDGTVIPTQSTINSQVKQEKRPDSTRVGDLPTHTENSNQLVESNDKGNQGDKVDILLISIKVGNVGLNLMSANNVILMDQSWNPHNDIQAEDRCHRIGQSRPVKIYKLFAKDTIEEYVIVKSTDKLHLNYLFDNNF